MLAINEKLLALFNVFTCTFASYGIYQKIVWHNAMPLSTENDSGALTEILIRVFDHLLAPALPCLPGWDKPHFEGRRSAGI